MAERTIKIPAEYAALGDAMEKMLAEAMTSAAAAKAGGEVDMAAVERQMELMAATVEREGIRRVLQSLDIDRREILIGGKRYRKVGRYEATYSTKAGPVNVMRSLYREEGKRNAKTVNTVSLRAGACEDTWLPETAKAMAFLVQNGTSREAEAIGEKTGRLTYSRCSFERVAHAVGGLHVAQHEKIEDVLIDEVEVPTEATSVSAALDRVSIPMEEPRARTPGRPKKNAPKRPIARNYRMAYCGTVTLHDQDGKALQTIRYGRMPQGNTDSLCRGMAGDVLKLCEKRPDLKVATLSDGAPEMGNLLASELDESILGKPILRLVDFWHLMEKLAAAALILSPEGTAALRQGWKLQLLNHEGAVGRILNQLRQSGLEEARVGRTRPVHDAITYLENNGDRMNYAAARRSGLPIGSGNVEATCKSLVEIRMKRSGSRWKETTGEQIIQLRALALSDRWDRAIDLTLAPLRRHVA